MILVERYDWLKLLFAGEGIDLDEDPDKLDDFLVSNKFKGNFWRLDAVATLYEAQKKTKTLISKEQLTGIESKLELALNYF